MTLKSRLLCLAGTVLISGCVANAQPELAVEPTGPVLKVCAAEDEMPYSNTKGEGFENKLAQLLGQGLNRKIKYVYWKDPRYFIRDFLNKGQCDVVIGVDAGDPRVATTQPYYRSAYVFISRQADDLDIQDWDSEVLRSVKLIGYVPGTPSEVMVRAIGRYSDTFNYNKSLVGFKSRRNQYVKYDVSKIVADVANGKAEVAVVWGPAAARYVKASTVPLTMVVVPDNSTRADGKKVQQHYSTAMAVRKGETALLQQLNNFIDHYQSEIEAILKDENIPLLPEVSS
ncbi:methanol oxidation system protein MoxJ [methane-oxidizing endosymbiont of Gigantopelta aegis]|uniref:methanol oxidation system protein MoxJ n=1 Tax=methane-oxidizing endosymbiont of Gigantopelta aegis TaxID=2794938 RepID=UPI0018DD046E|nr:methanol oxidation system protein MoxJ [methane-oxidizing endosymbiont of Gigantopelta aegis]